MFKRMTLSGWRQFGEVDLSFHPRLTVITGTNGAGKSTLLALLASTFGSFSGGKPFVATKAVGEPGYEPDVWDADLRWFGSMLAGERIESKKGRIEQAMSALRGRIAGYERDRQEQLLRAAEELAERWQKRSAVGRLVIEGAERQIGIVEFGNGYSWPLMIPTSVGSSYSLGLLGRDGHMGFHIPSHRALYAYHHLDSLPLSLPCREEMFSRFITTLHKSGTIRPDHVPHNYRLKEILIALAIFGFGSEIVQPDPEARQLFEEFQEILRGFLPPKLGFQRFHIRPPEVVLITKSGEFSLDAVSGGIASLIDVAWMLFTFAPKDAAYSVTFDEPENHLHPELQKAILPNLLKVFPNVQFVVATHNPLVLASVPDSNVYVLRHDETGLVRSHLLDAINRAGTANEILRDVLGLDYTMPLWVGAKLDEIVKEFAGQGVTYESLGRLRVRLDEAGLGTYVPEAIGKLVPHEAAK